jgi:hypothetical protein
MANATYAPAQHPRVWPGRFGVYHRTGPKAPWTLLIHAGSREAATKAMFALMAAPGRNDRGGDWTVASTSDPPRRPKVW